MGRISMNVDAVGMEDVLKRLDNLDKLPQRATKALTAGANIVLAAAKDLAPVRAGSGRLKKALKVGRRAKNRDRYSVEVGAFYGEAPHAHLVEHGHGGPKAAPPHPFLEPAVEMTEAQVEDAIMAELMKGLE